MKILEQLLAVQAELKAPKGQYNSFGKYKYRSCEDILEAVKPLLQRQKLTLVVSDQIVTVEDRVYVKATAPLRNTDGEILQSTAFAREPDKKTGMDESQITGTASSYARKYALNGLFLIDDTKDADTDENQLERDNRQRKKEDQKEAPPASPSDEEILKCSNCGAKITPSVHDYSCKAFKRPLCLDCQKKEKK